jgi:hypothetical protein
MIYIYLIDKLHITLISLVYRVCKKPLRLFVFLVLYTQNYFNTTKSFELKQLSYIGEKGIFALFLRLIKSVATLLH